MIGIASIPFVAAIFRGAASFVRPKTMPVSLHAGEKEIIMAVAQSLLEVEGIGMLEKIGNVVYPVGGDGKLLGGGRKSSWGMTLVTADLTSNPPKIAHVLFDFSEEEDICESAAICLANIMEGIPLSDAEREHLARFAESGEDTCKLMIQTEHYAILLAILNLKTLGKHQKSEHLGRGR